MVLIVDALTSQFGEVFWKFIENGEYRNKVTSRERPQFFRFDKPQNVDFPKMIELFGRTDYALIKESQMTPVHIDDDISSLSAILLDSEYYQCLLMGKTEVDGISVLRPEYLIVFKAKAFLDLTKRKAKGESVDSKNIRKHKNDILRLAAEMRLMDIPSLPDSVKADMKEFVNALEKEPFNLEMTGRYGQSPDAIKEKIVNVLGLK